VKGQPIEQKKTFVNHGSDMGLVSRTYKEILIIKKQDWTWWCMPAIPDTT
jgi:hypothetical protein